MNPLYVSLIQLGLSFLSQFLSSLKTNSVPQEVVDGIQAALTALENHKNDLMTKNQWESLRG